MSQGAQTFRGQRDEEEPAGDQEGTDREIRSHLEGSFKEEGKINCQTLLMGQVARRLKIHPSDQKKKCLIKQFSCFV